MIIFLLNKTEDKDKHILMQIYDNYRKDMLAAAMSILHDAHLAEDAVQDTFIRIINKMHLIKKISCNGLRSYTVLITKSIAINMINKMNKHKVVPIEDYEFALAADDVMMDEKVLNGQIVSQIRKSLNEMDEKYAHPMLLRYYYGFSDSETAELLCIDSTSTVRSRCLRGRKIIMGKLAQGGDRY